MIVNPYILIYTNKKGICKNMIKYKLMNKKIDYLKDNNT